MRKAAGTATIAASAGSAIHTAQLHAETQRRAREMSTLAELGNDIAASRDLLPISESNRMRAALKLNYLPFIDVHIQLAASMNALLKDKKNSTTELGLILPVGQEANIEKVMVPPNDEFVEQFRIALGALAQ